jgi:hypothetical protein
MLAVLDSCRETMIEPGRTRVVALSGRAQTVASSKPAKTTEHEDHHQAGPLSRPPGADRSPRYGQPVTLSIHTGTARSEFSNPHLIRLRAYKL